MFVFRLVRLRMTGSDLNSVCGSSDQTTMRAQLRLSQARSIVARERRDRRLPGSSRSRRIKRAAAAQKTLWFALALPTHAEMRACPDTLARPVVPVFCGLGSGADDLIIQSYMEPETERPIQKHWACLSSYENVRASRERGPSVTCSRCAG